MHIVLVTNKNNESVGVYQALRTIRTRGLVLTGGGRQDALCQFENIVKLIINNRLVGQLVRFNGTFQQNLGYIALLGL